jgi:small subunit ribosomal protein S1
MVDDHNEMDEFEDLFEKGGARAQKRFEPGERITATVIHVGEKHAMLDVGGGRDGLMDMAGLHDKDGRAMLRVGDKVDGYVLRVANRIVEVTRSLGKGFVNASMLEEARQSGLPVDGVVSGVNKGGYEIAIAGTTGFCPLGQMDPRRIEDPKTLIGQKLQFRVMDMRGHDVILSRKALLEQQAAEKAAETRKRLRVGERFTGTVVNVRDFGAFVDIGGIEGMVPASELAYGRNRPQDIVHPGDEVQVEVMDIGPGKDGRIERISLSMRALAQDPFEQVAPHLTPGTVLKGLVRKVEAFGAFVELVPGVEGLIHVSAFGKRIGKPADIVSPGEDAYVRVDAADPAARRISLAWLSPAELDAKVDFVAPGKDFPNALRFVGHVKAAEPAPVVSAEREAAAPTVPRQKPAVIAPSVGQVVAVVVDRVEAFGVFVKWETGRGLVPNVELELPLGADARRCFPIGAEFQAVVQEVRPDGKVRLSKKGAQDVAQRADAEAWMRTQAPMPGGAAGVGSFGELLMAKLQQKPKK